MSDKTLKELINHYCEQLSLRKEKLTLLAEELERARASDFYFLNFAEICTISAGALAVPLTQGKSLLYALSGVFLCEGLKAYLKKTTRASTLAQEFEETAGPIRRLLFLIKRQLKQEEVLTDLQYYCESCSDVPFVFIAECARIQRELLRLPETNHDP